MAAEAGVTRRNVSAELDCAMMTGGGGCSVDDKVSPSSAPDSELDSEAAPVASLRLAVEACAEGALDCRADCGCVCRGGCGDSGPAKDERSLRMASETETPLRPPGDLTSAGAFKPVAGEEAAIPINAAVSCTSSGSATNGTLLSAACAAAIAAAASSNAISVVDADSLTAAAVTTGGGDGMMTARNCGANTGSSHGMRVSSSPDAANCRNKSHAAATDC
jgi:hypothetical protein